LPFTLPVPCYGPLTEINREGSYTVFLNGQVLGIHTKPQKFASRLRAIRRRGLLGRFTSVHVQVTSNLPIASRPASAAHMNSCTLPRVTRTHSSHKELLGLRLISSPPHLLTSASLTSACVRAGHAVVRQYRVRRRSHLPPPDHRQ